MFSQGSLGFLGSSGCLGLGSVCLGSLGLSPLGLGSLVSGSPGALCFQDYSGSQSYLSSLSGSFSSQIFFRFFML